jgi:hypothetical protein
VFLAARKAGDAAIGGNCAGHCSNDLVEFNITFYGFHGKNQVIKGGYFCCKALFICSSRKDKRHLYPAGIKGGMMIGLIIKYTINDDLEDTKDAVYCAKGIGRA